MPCLLALLALAAPRVVIVLLVIFTNFIGRAFDTAVWPLLGFIFLPTTTLAYAFAINRNGRVGGLYLVAVVIAVLVDVGLIGSGRSWFIRRRSSS